MNYTKNSPQKFPQNLEEWPPIMQNKQNGWILHICNAATENKLWEWLGTENPPEDEGYIFWEDPNIKRIENDKEVYTDAHSGFSWGCSMRNAKYIAKYGFDKWTEECNKSD